MNVWPVFLPICLQENNCNGADMERRDRHLLTESTDKFKKKKNQKTSAVYSTEKKRKNKGKKGGGGGWFRSVS